MQAPIKITTDFAAARALIARAGKAAEAPAVPDAIGAAAANRVRACFRAGKDPWGTPWRRLKNSSRKRGGASAKPLRDTGRLRNSIRHRRAARGVIVGSGVRYAASDIKRMARRMRDAGHDGATRKAVLTKFFTKGIQTPPEKIDGGMMWRIRAGVVKFYPEIERHRWRWKKEK